jgi:two-component system, chemotaxis family, sensor kinase Cph1
MDAASIHYPDQVNLENCAKEPIHLIGRTQEHGVLLACNFQTLEITQAGANAITFFGISTDDLPGTGISSLIGEEKTQELKKQLDIKENLPLQVRINGKVFLMLPHLSGQNLILDFEPFPEEQDSLIFQNQLSTVLNRFQKALSVNELSNAAAIVIKKMFGYHRVMIYRFDEQWNGEVIAEEREEEMEAWLGLHYPATDIPEQSRKLFLSQRVRIISKVDYSPVPIMPGLSPLTGEPLDISQSGLRAVSPIHIEYLKNMGVGASLTAAIVVRGKLWGLIACHHNSEKYLDFHSRERCRFVAHTLSNELTLLETNSQISKFQLSENIRRQLVVQMNFHKDLRYALTRDTVKFTDVIDCGGGAIFIKDEWELTGNTPNEAQLDRLLKNFIKKQSNSVYLTRNLSAEFPEAGKYRTTASGLLSLKIAENKFLLWFKPEVVQVVNWGGDPNNKAFYNEKEQRLSPRKSFEKWTEKLTGTSEPWDDLDKNIARSLRENISHVLLAQQREEIEALNLKLIEANKELELFSYGLSHDLRAPVRGMEGFLNILQEDHAKELGEDGRIMLHKTRELTERMNNLIDNILEYSRLSHTEGLKITTINNSEVIKEVLELFNAEESYPKTDVVLQPEMPTMHGDRRMIFQLWANLLNNALKYSAEKEKPLVEVGTTLINGREVFMVKDNGIGINPEYKKKIFETFQRAVGSRFKGTGIGLAIVNKIVEKHNGEVWVESVPGEGSQFYFYLEAQKKETEA